MRLDARNGDTNWQCFDVQRCALVHEVVWVDTDTATWGAPDLSPGALLATLVTGHLSTRTHYEKRIQIVPERRMVLFNPVDGDPDETVRDVIEEELAPKPQREFTR
jgi:hypothetical protein